VQSTQPPTGGKDDQSDNIVTIELLIYKYVKLNNQTGRAAIPLIHFDLRVYKKTFFWHAVCMGGVVPVGTGSAGVKGCLSKERE
jgi:hypothetical protein